MVVPVVIIVGVFPTPHAGTRRVADRAVGVGVGEHDAFVGEAVHGGGCVLHGGVAHAAQFAAVHAFGVDEDDVGGVGWHLWFSLVILGYLKSI